MCSRIDCEECSRKPPPPDSTSSMDSFEIFGFDGYKFCSILVFCIMNLLFLIGVFSPFSSIGVGEYRKNCLDKFGELIENFFERSFTALGSFCARNPLIVLSIGKLSTATNENSF